MTHSVSKNQEIFQRKICELSFDVGWNLSNDMKWKNFIIWEHLRKGKVRKRMWLECLVVVQAIEQGIVCCTMEIIFSNIKNVGLLKSFKHIRWLGGRWDKRLIILRRLQQYRKKRWWAWDKPIAMKRENRELEKSDVKQLKMTQVTAPEGSWGIRTNLKWLLEFWFELIALPLMIIRGTERRG